MSANPSESGESPPSAAKLGPMADTSVGGMFSREKPQSFLKPEGLPYLDTAKSGNEGKANRLPTIAVSDDVKVVMAKMPGLETLREPKKELASNSKRMRSVERAERILELEKEAKEEENPRLSQTVLLTIAGYYVGDDDWDKAEGIYEKLKVSPYPEIRAASVRNLDVVQRNQAILSEQDSGRREWMELELAGVHQQYGHEKASKAMYRTLEKDSTLPAVRQEAAQRLASYVSPPLIVPQSSQSKECSK